MPPRAGQRQQLPITAAAGCVAQEDTAVSSLVVELPGACCARPSPTTAVTRAAGAGMLLVAVHLLVERPTVV
jgi:hypothetical protein